jgi:hypothetical protein
MNRTADLNLRRFGAVILLVVLFGCSDDATAPETAPPVDDYLKSLPSWSEVSPPQPASDGPTAPPDTCYTWEDSGPYICAETPCSITDTPEQIVTFNVGSDLMWPGALIQGHTYLGGLGTMEELPIRQRAPLTVSIDLLMGENAIDVVDPDLASVNAAVGRLISQAQQAGHQGGSAIYYEKTTAHSVDQAALKLGLSAKYMGFSARAQLDQNRSVTENTVAAFFKQRMFTVSVVQPQTPGEFFSDDFTPDLLQEQVEMGRIGPGSPPVYVSSIVYGRLLMLTMTSTASREQMVRALDASYESAAGGGSAAVSDTHLTVLNDAKIQVVAVGGNASHVLSLLRSGELGDYFASDADLTSAMPIAYSLRNLRDNTLATVAETTDYVIQECQAGQTGYFNSESAWRRVANAPDGSEIYTFYPNRNDVLRADEVTSAPANNGNLPATLTFRGVNMDPPLPFDFRVSCRQPSGSNFTYNDNEFDSSKYPLLSVGDVDTAQDDDFEIEIIETYGVTVTGIGVAIGDNTETAGEWLEVYDDSGRLLEIFTANMPRSGGYVFTGVTTAPFGTGSILYNEDSGGDDICLQGFWFATMP